MHKYAFGQISLARAEYKQKESIEDAILRMFCSELIKKFYRSHRIVIFSHYDKGRTMKDYDKTGGFDLEILRVEHLMKKYGRGENEVIAVNDMSFSVEQGEFVAIVGSSGSGKSTLLHLLGGVDRPTSGKVFIEGTDIYELNDDKLAIFRRRQVGLIYQFYNLIPILNVEENIALPCELDGRTVEPQAMKEMLATLGLKERVAHLPNQLSGGQQQRVSIGRALINHPAIVLADEPTGNLDSKSSDEIVELLKISNQKYKQTIIIITHNMEIAKMAGRILRIEDGRLVQEV